MSPRISARSMLEVFPEELLERILFFCVVAPPQVKASRPAWLPSRTHSSPYTRLTPLIVCTTFYRIALPHYYHTIHLTSSAHSSCLRTLLHRRPFLSRSVRHLVINNISTDTHQALRRCDGLTVLDITLDPYISPHEAHAFCDALQTRHTITSFTLRKQHNIYLTMPSVRQFMTRLAGAIAYWPRLESAHLAFRVSDDDAIAAIVCALALAPRLGTFATELPNLWNEAIRCVSENPRLERIVLGGIDGQRSTMGVGTGGGGLYMVQARKHPRLAELIKNGTPMIRVRAHTMIVPPQLVSSLSEVAKKGPPPPQVVRHRSLKRGGRFY